MINNNCHNDKVIIQYCHNYKEFLYCSQSLAVILAYVLTYMQMINISETSSGNGNLHYHENYYNIMVPRSCTPVMHPSHAHRSCTPVMRPSHAPRSGTPVMHPGQAPQSCTPVMHPSHAPLQDMSLTMFMGSR